MSVSMPPSPPHATRRVVTSAEQAHHLKMVKLLGRNKINAPHSSMREQLRRIRQQERNANK